jgi:glycosyltransferase involved in cell wall biosynthesis
LLQRDNDEERAEWTPHSPESRLGPFVVALVPAFNEQKRIAEVISHARNFTSKVLVCDDGSTDSTARISLDSGAEVIRHSRNAGYGAALRSLFLKARSMSADAFVTLDSDGQHDAGFIPALVEPIIRGKADLVIGSRFLSKKLDFTPPHRRVAIKLITRLCDITGQYGFTDMQSGFRAYNGKALAVTCPIRHGMGASTEIVKRATSSRLRIREIPVPVYYNGEGPSVLGSVFQFLDVLRATLASSIPNERP